MSTLSNPRRHSLLIGTFIASIGSRSNCNQLQLFIISQSGEMRLHQIRCFQTLLVVKWKSRLPQSDGSKPKDTQLLHLHSQHDSQGKIPQFLIFIICFATRTKEKFTDHWLLLPLFIDSGKHIFAEHTDVTLSIQRAILPSRGFLMLPRMPGFLKNQLQFLHAEAARWVKLCVVQQHHSCTVGSQGCRELLSHIPHSSELCQHLLKEGVFKHPKEVKAYLLPTHFFFLMTKVINALSVETG